MTTRVTATPAPDLVWRATISGLLAELTTEVRELAEVVIAMNEKLAALEASNTDKSQE